MNKNNETLNNLIVKYIDYATEEYVETLMTKEFTAKVLQSINPYIGVISYPSRDFLLVDLTYNKRVQFQNMTYVGHMDFLLPPLNSLSNVGLSFTLLSFNLDGKVRRFVQISGGDNLAPSGQTFRDFILTLYPDGNSEGFAFNRHAFHYLTDIEITGGTYQVDAVTGNFILTNSGAGAFTPSIEFEFSISGYKCLLQ
jgi:hypothetical protein